MQSLGQPFNPHMHEGLFQVDDASKPHNTIHTVMREGYKIGDRVLRAAQVGTVKNQNKPAESAETKSA